MDSVYVDLKYDEISLTFTAGFWSVCEVVVGPYVYAVVTMIVMRVLLFVLHVCMLKECEGGRLMAMLMWGIYEV